MQDISPESFQKRCRRNFTFSDYIDRLYQFVRLHESHNNSIRVGIDCMVDIPGMGMNILLILSQQQRIQSIYDKWRIALGIVKKQHKINIFNPLNSYPLGRNSFFSIKYKNNWGGQHIENHLKVVPRDTGHCTAISDNFAVLSNGICTFCCADYEGKLNLGSVYKNTLEEIYYSKKAILIRNAENRGKFVAKRCQICRGSIVFKKNLQPTPSRNLLTDLFILKYHAKRFGLKSAIYKVIEALQRRGWV